MEAKPDAIAEALREHAKVCPLLVRECLRNSCAMRADHGGELDGHQRCAVHHIGMYCAEQRFK